MTSFPDPNVIPEFTGDNGITYSWDEDDGKWVVKGFESDPNYLRLDTANDPLEDDLEIAATDFGDGKLTLQGKRDNANNACATIEFKNELEDADAKTGYLTYFTKDENQYFKLNQDVSFDGNTVKAVGKLQIYNNGSIDAGSTPKIILSNPTSGGDGNGAVEIQRPGNWRRSFTIRGKDEERNDLDIFWSSSSADEADAVNYNGKTSGDFNIINRKTMVGYIDDVLGVSLENYEQINYELLKEDLTIVEGAWTGSAGEDNLKVEDLDGVSTHVGWMPNNTGKIYLGQPLKFTHDSGVRYGRVEAVWSNSNTTHLTVGDWAGDPFVDGEKTTVEYQKTLFATEEYVDNAVSSAYGLPTSLQLGSYLYARTNDASNAGYIKSNTSTDPGQISQLIIHKQNNDGIVWPKALLDGSIKEKMYISLRKTDSDYYQGRITGVTTAANTVTVTLSYIKSAGVMQLGQAVDVYIAYNRSEGVVARL